MKVEKKLPEPLPPPEYVITLTEKEAVALGDALGKLTPGVGSPLYRLYDKLDWILGY